MGLEIGVIMAGVSALTTVVGTVASTVSASQSAEAQKQANATAAAQNKVDSLESRRQKIREERIRRASILAKSENSGTAGSSGELGAVSALSSNLNRLVSTSSGKSRTNDTINKFNQQAADHDFTAQAIGSITTGIRQGLSNFQTVFDSP